MSFGRWSPAALAIAALSCSSSSPPAAPANGGAPAFVMPSFLDSAGYLVNGHNEDNVYLDCRTVLCRHNENTDLTSWNGATYFVHRSAISQVLGPDSALHIYKSIDGGKSFAQMALLPAPVDRDIRDPHFYQVNGDLRIKALARLPVVSTRDSNVDTEVLGTRSSDGVNWDPWTLIGPPEHGWSFWRIKEVNGIYYSAAYQDGDLQVVLYSSTDGVNWTAGAPIYTISDDTPLETELTFMPSGKLLALVRMDGTDSELLGDQGRLRTKICWADPPYTTFTCPSEFDGQRLDGPLSFFWNSRLFVIARKHLQGTGKKRTSLFEITGDFDDGGDLQITEHGELPSAGDTSYAGIAMVDPTHAVITWYSGDIVLDRPWVLGMYDLTDIWRGMLDFSKL